MSWDALALVEKMRFHRDGKKLTLVEKVILDRIAYRHDSSLRYAQVGKGYLAEQALCGETAVKDAIKSCESHGTLLVERMQRRAGYHDENMYFFADLEIRDRTSRGREILQREQLEGGALCALPQSPADLPPSAPSDLPRGAHGDSGAERLRREEPQSGAHGDPKSSLKLKPSNPPPPTPSVPEGGNATPRVASNPETPRYMRLAGATIEIFSGRKSRVITKREIDAMAGARPEDYLAFFRGRGFKARIVTPEELEERKSA